MTIDLPRYSRIPSLPTVAVQILRAFSDPDTSLDQITTIIRNDPAIVGKLLKAANSAHYGSRGEVTELRRAVMLLGRNSVTPLILSFSLAQQSSGSSAHGRHYSEIWLRSFVQATAAEVIGSQFGSPALRGEAYTLNLLAGIGKLALLRADPEKYLECLERSKAESSSLAPIEEQVLGFTHTELSAALLRQLGLPDRCVEPIRALDRNSAADAALNADYRQLLLISRVADATACLLCDKTPGVAIVALAAAMEELALPNGLSSETLVGLVQDRIEATASLFDIDAPKLPSPNELLQEALEQLSFFAVQSASPEPQAAVPNELKEENGRLQRRVNDLLLATRTDNLTGIFNRAWFLSQLAERVAIHRVRGQSIALAVIDIDKFKSINDTYGHQAGDHVLRTVAQALPGTLRESDLVARYGGEEFVVLMDDANADGLHIVGERLRAAVEALDVAYEGKKIPVTISIGLTESPVVGNESDFARQLFGAADAAMYRAKREGRNRFCVEPLAVSTEAADLLASIPGAVKSRPELAATK